MTIIHNIPIYISEDKIVKTIKTLNEIEGIVAHVEKQNFVTRCLTIDIDIHQMDQFGIHEAFGLGTLVGQIQAP